MRSLTWSLILAWVMILFACAGVAWGSAIVATWPAPVRLMVFGILVMIGAGVILWARNRNRDSLPYCEKLTFAEMYFNDPSYRYSREMCEDVVDTAALVEQMRSGRHMNEHATVYLNLTGAVLSDYSTMANALWIVEHGPQRGVYIQFMDGDRKLSPAEADRIILENAVTKHTPRPIRR